ncbi:MAG: site-2 protease family protein [Alphaproteobacteria bacterium]|nr:site-2 protease family protein [Alphaproteobacteria bacterium]
MTSIYTLTTWIIPLLLCIILHEVAHGYVALKLGDKTAWLMGRLNMNPAKHFDLIGCVFVPVFLLLIRSPILFGWAKPVPVDFSHLNNPKRDTGLVAAAGPIANLLLAIVFVLVGRLALWLFPTVNPIMEWFIQNLKNGITFSLVLACFNLLPILPMDGGRILWSVLPKKLANLYSQTEKYGLFILIGVLFLLPMMGLDLVGWFVGTLYPIFAGFVNIFI